MTLTAMELSLLREIAEGKSNAEIAEALGKTIGTVRVQAHALVKKAGARSRVGLAVRAVREGWVDPPPAGANRK